MKLSRTVLFEMSSPFPTSIEALDLTILRQAYSLLFDRVAQEVFRHRLDLDDVEVERFMVCRNADQGMSRIPLSSLADHSTVVRCVTANAGVAIVEIGAVVMQDQSPSAGSGESSV